MPDSLTFLDVREDFVPDGGLRDLYAFETSEDSWRSFLDAVFDSEWPVDLRVDGTATNPSEHTTATLLDAETPALMSVSVGGTMLNCHFFTVTEIELDLDPTEINEANFPSLLRFITLMADSSGRNVFVTQDSNPEDGIFAYHHEESRAMLLSRPTRSTVLGGMLKQALGRIVVPFKGRLRSSHSPAGGTDTIIKKTQTLGTDVPTSSDACEAAREWTKSIYYPNQIEWHTRLTTEEYGTLRRLDIAFDLFFGRCGPDEICRIGGFEMEALNQQFWDSLEAACRVFGVSLLED